ncbi:MAG: helix-turn-helix domain-containing protein [Myxococcota bacterium]
MRWQVFCDSQVDLADLERKLLAGPALSGTTDMASEPPLDAPAGPLAAAVARAERQAIIAALAEAEGNISRAARTLEIDRNTLKRKIRRLDIPHSPLPRGRPADRW